MMGDDVRNDNLPLQFGFVSIISENRTKEDKVVIPEELKSKVPEKKKPPFGFVNVRRYTG
jgi:hypothetical protein